MSGDMLADPPTGKISREAYYAWSLKQSPGRYERVDGVIVRMAAERVDHVRLKYSVWQVLRDAIVAAGVACEALGDGVTVQVGDDHDYEPDATVNCGERIAGNELHPPNPVILVEVVSPSTQSRDETAKLIDYFTLACVQHYLIVYGVRRMVVHHRRTADGIATAVLGHGPLRLDPPGLVIEVADLWEDGAMSSSIAAPPSGRMTRAEYFAWTEQQPRGRFERSEGVVVAMAPERAGHALVKTGVWAEFRRAVRAAGVACEVFPDGMTVSVGEQTDYEPDCVVSCGPRVPRESLVVPNAIVVVEVESPPTRSLDAGLKLANYFRVDSIVHYLLVSTRKRVVVHHRRSGDGAIATTIVSSGTIALDPPGISVDVAGFYEDTPDIPE